MKGYIIEKHSSQLIKFMWKLFYLLIIIPIKCEAAESYDHSYLKELLLKIFEYLGFVWNYPLFTMDNQPIALSNIVVAVIFLVIGLNLAKIFSLAVKNKLLKVLKIDPSVTDALGKLSHYIFIIVISLIVLDVAHVPLTVFTFVGGTLAISAGVGGQHIANNFISGLVTMIERPIRINDVIEVEDLVGKVIDINIRCITVRTYTNKIVYIPHSILLQNKLTNCSTQETIRLETKISVNQNGKTPRLIESIISDALSNFNLILATPKAEILLASFENNILNYEIAFFINTQFLFKRRQIISETNYLIEESLRKKNILLAIPERTIFTKEVT